MKVYQIVFNGTLVGFTYDLIIVSISPATGVLEVVAVFLEEEVRQGHSCR